MWEKKINHRPRGPANDLNLIMSILFKLSPSSIDTLTDVTLAGS